MTATRIIESDFDDLFRLNQDPEVAKTMAGTRSSFRTGLSATGDRKPALRGKGARAPQVLAANREEPVLAGRRTSQAGKQRRPRRRCRWPDSDSLSHALA